MYEIKDLFLVLHDHVIPAQKLSDIRSTILMEMHWDTIFCPIYTIIRYIKSAIDNGILLE
jgi:hypothetical protein